MINVNPYLQYLCYPSHIVGRITRNQVQLFARRRFAVGGTTHVWPESAPLPCDLPGRSADRLTRRWTTRDTRRSAPRISGGPQHGCLERSAPPLKQVCPEHVEGAAGVVIPDATASRRARISRRSPSSSRRARIPSCCSMRPDGTGTFGLVADQLMRLVEYFACTWR